MAEKNEICAGCGAEAPPKAEITEDGVVVSPGVHPWVGIGSPDLKVGTTHEDDGDPHPSQMVAYPVCAACQLDNRHQTKQQLKVHFHEKKNEKVALLLAQNQVLLVDPTPAQKVKHQEYLKEKAKRKLAAKKADADA